MATMLTAPGKAPAPEAAPPMPHVPSRRLRLEYLDALKVALIVLVIAHHAGQSFAPTGGAWPLYNADRAPILDKFFTINAAFFMGLFFLISAYFLPASFEHKGPRRYLRERLVRLGTPLGVLLGGALLYEFIQTVIMQGGSLWTAIEYAWSSMVLDQHFMHLWFLDQLLIYSALYVVWRLLTAHRSSTEPLPVPSNAAIIAFAVCMALATFLVMGVSPVNTWIALFGFFTTEPAHLPQYASLFVVGLLAYEGQWLTRMSTRQGMLWLGIGLALSALWCIRPFGATGGFSVGTLMRSTWEAFECVSLCIGLLVLFREVVSSAPRVIQMMAPNAYGVYIVHIFIVVPLQFAIIGLAAGPLVKFALVVLLAVPISFGLAALLRRLPVLRAVL